MVDGTARFDVAPTSGDGALWEDEEHAARRTAEQAIDTSAAVPRWKRDTEHSYRAHRYPDKSTLAASGQGARGDQLFLEEMAPPQMDWPFFAAVQEPPAPYP